MTLPLLTFLFCWFLADVIVLAAFRALAAINRRLD